MICQVCDEPLTPGMKFCSGCGTPAGGREGNTASTGGGDVHGGLYQAGRDVVVNPTPDKPAPASYEAIPKWRSPFTQGALSWLGLFVGLFGLFPLWKLVQPMINLVRSGTNEALEGGTPLVWMGIFFAALLIVVLVLGLRRITKFQLRKPLIFGWAVSGAGGRIMLEKIRVGRCPQCGGKMTYLNKATKWIDHREANGRKWREVTERVPALECRRNAKHWFEVDPAEDEES